MTKVLIVGDLSSTASLSKKIAADNPFVEVDYIGSHLNDFKRIKNLNFIDSRDYLDKGYLQDIIDRISQTHENYDFIYAHDVIFQESKEFDTLRSSINTPVLCPYLYSAELETNKSKCKKILKKLDILVPESVDIDSENLGAISDYFKKNNLGVFKVDNAKIPSGHGTLVSDSDGYENWIKSIRKIYPNNKIFLEDYIEGQELSFHILSNGSEWIYLGSSRDYKKLHNDDKGQNTTSMGSYAPVDYLTQDLYTKIAGHADKIIDFLNKESKPYIGIMYLGIIIDKNNVPWILEINTRPGNPEFSAMLPIVQSDILENLIAAAKKQTLKSLDFNSRHAVSVQLIHQNYSYKFPGLVHHPRLNLDTDISVNIFQRFNLFENIHACITADGENLQEAADTVYEYLDQQVMNSYRYRNDIGKLI